MAVTASERTVKPRSRVLRVAAVVDETADARSISFAVPDEDRELFAYRPGQFLTVRIPSERTGSVARCYSLASSPHAGEPLTVTVKRTAQGYGSNWLCDNVAVGRELEVLAPSGQFSPRDLDVDLLLAAGGSGITPVLSILKSVLREGRGHVTLLYANRDERSVIFAGELRALTAAYPDRLTVLHWLESVQGIPQRVQLRHLLGGWAGRETFVCGPAPFMDAVRDALAAAGAPAESVHVEVFSSLSGDPFAEIVLPGRPAGGGAANTVDSAVRGPRAVVELEGDTREVEWIPGATLVDVLLANGVDAPYSCRDGVCGSCQATVLKGSVRMLANDVLDEDDVAQGFVLGCQSVPDEDAADTEFHFRF